MAEGCLHCVLSIAAKEWLKTHGRCPPEDVMRMAAQFLSELMRSQHPGLSGEALAVMIGKMTPFNVPESESSGRLH